MPRCRCALLLTDLGVAVLKILVAVVVRADQHAAGAVLDGNLTAGQGGGWAQELAAQLQLLGKVGAPSRGARPGVRPGAGELTQAARL